jgi:hypothetical protein
MQHGQFDDHTDGKFRKDLNKCLDLGAVDIRGPIGQKFLRQLNDEAKGPALQAL